jgi:hypothetical protein
MGLLVREKKKPLDDDLAWDRDPRWIEFNKKPGELDAEHQRLLKELGAAERRREAAIENHGSRVETVLDAVLDGAVPTPAKGAEDEREAARREICVIREAIKTNRAVLRRWERRVLELQWELRAARQPALEAAYRDALKTLPDLMRAASQIQERLQALRDLAGNPGWPSLDLPDMSAWLADVERFLRGD